MANRGIWIGVALAGAVLLACVYGYASFGLSRGVDVTAYSSGIYDMDVRRVVLDLTTDQRGYRTSVHPLQKLMVAPFGIWLQSRSSAETRRLDAARILISAFMIVQALLVGWLTFQLTHRSPAPAVAAGLVTGLSFSSVLAASVPESAALSSIATSVPLVFLLARSGRTFHWREAALWGVMGVLCIGLTITQIIPWLIALGVRVAFELRRARAAGKGADLRGLGRNLVLCAAILASLTWAGVRLQAQVFPGTQEFYAENPLEVERHFYRSEKIRSVPLQHTSRLLLHFVLFDFVSPFPAYSDFLIQKYGLRWWSLSIEETGFDQWRAPQLALAAALLAALAIACALLRRADASFLAPALCVASQFGLHFFYGREYILYSPHWHGVLVAILIAASWNSLSRRRWAVLAAAGALSGAMLVNDLVVLKSVYEEVDAGLGVDVRDTRGELR